MDSWTIKRGAIKRKLTNFHKFLTGFDAVGISDISTCKKIELRSRLQTILPLMDEFELIQSQIEQNATDIEKEYDYRDALENSYFELVSKTKELLGDTDSSPTSQVSVSVQPAVHEPSETASPHQAVRLPTISLPKFSGQCPLEWVEFRDLFTSLIHQNAQITPIQKFHYLRASLEASASDVIRSLDFCADNYETAWKTLCERFNNTRMMVHNHIKAIFDLEPVAKENSSKLRNITDALFKHLNSLKSILGEASILESILIYIISNKLDGITLREWETEKNLAGTELPTIAELMRFINNKANLLETIEPKQPKMFAEKPRMSRSLVVSDAASSTSCPMCERAHSLHACDDFLKLNSSSKALKARELRVCLNCLRSGHMVKQCRSKFTCRQCKRKHHTLLHIEHSNNNIQTIQQPEEVVSALSSHKSQVLLPTVSVFILDADGKRHKAKAILDSGSQSHFISDRLCKKIKVKTEPVSVNICGITKSSSNVNSKCNVSIRACHTNFSAELTSLIINRITSDLPSIKFDPSDIKIPNNIKLADPRYYEPGPIDLLIGAPLFWDLLCVGQISLGRNLPILQKTKLGWIVSGHIIASDTKVSSCNFVQVSDVQEQLARFWEIDQFPAERSLSEEEAACETNFVTTTIRNPEGRFVVTIPLKDDPKVLGRSYHNAEKQFLNLEKKLESNPKLKQMYTDFLEEYQEMGHMSLVTDHSKDSETAYYLPHHGVLKEESLTTKLRVVFNASAPTSSGKSLNDIQLVGPTIQNDLVSILLRFRQHKFAVSADIAKMYRQVLIHSDQRRLQRILWRANPSQSLKIYNLNTVTYGTASASFLAIRSLSELATECQNANPKVSIIIKNDFYVDDLLTGFDDLSEAQSLCKKIHEVLASGCFPLKKWISNEASTLKNISQDDIHPYMVRLGSHESAKTLGLHWSFQSDTLQYVISNQASRIVTKRLILAEISQIYDPIGLLGPCTLLAKSFLQQLWMEKLSWDESVSLSLQNKWILYRNELATLRKIQIPRKILIDDHKQVELHAFCDASNSGYGAVIYVKSTNSKHESAVHLICSKGRVAPLKPMTIPCLELCGALILSKLVEKVCKSLRLSISKITCWTDSTIVLGWLRTIPCKLKTFVCNRVIEISNLTQHATWRHVPTISNPADLLSRGTMPSQLVNSQIWWNGPSWLSGDAEYWPAEPLIPKDLPQLKREITVLSVSTELSIFERFSSFTKLQRIIAYCLRFYNNCSSSTIERRNGPFSCSELKKSTKTLIKMAQADTFSEEIKSLRKNLPLKTCGHIIRLNPFIDEEGIIRVGGRLLNSHYSYSKKHPMLISGRHKLGKLLFENEHIRLLHCGPQMLLASTRENFWVTSGRNLANSVIRKCVKCFRARPTNNPPQMGNLPSSRIQQTSVFSITGVDYAGPIIIRDRKGRGCKNVKSYICLFICFVTKAIHLELVTSLDTPSFILALRRFIGRRGKPSVIYSDNGRNFIGANNELNELGQFLKNNDIAKDTSSLNIDWKFIPTHSPHFGGLWESGVKSVKRHIKTVAGNAKLTYEEFSTLLVQVESILNSRPLFPISSDPNDLQPITPGHFLIGRSLTSIPDPDLTALPENRLNVYQRMQTLQRHIWKRWSKEYLSTLQTRCKWKRGDSSLKIGQLVVIREDNLAPLHWKLGRIVAVHPGNDGIVRVASVRTTTGLVRLSFSKLCPLPIADYDSANSATSLKSA